jgi:hypothetical protein
MKKSSLIFLLIFIFSAQQILAATYNAIPRPPQLVLLAFDGSLNIDMWKETLTFAKNNKLKLTYFISGVYFLLDNNRHDYIEPTRGAGKSNIGFAGDSKEKLIARVNYVNNAYDAGHTIGSHANGHFDESFWKVPNWELEFKEFNHLIFDVYNQKGFENENSTIPPFHFKPEEIVGFRAPLLSTNSGLYKTLKKNHFSFDTSQTASMDYWPEKNNDLWNFPLAELRIFGSGKQTLSMDYNFYYTQSGGNPDLKNSEKYRDEMFKTYMGYFHTNYYGNRAPIHIGHHFSKWNGGAYWKAFSDFAKTVCVMPEVKCVNYQALVDFMESLPPEMRNNYQLGNFPKLSTPKPAIESIKSVTPIDVAINVTLNPNEDLVATITGKHANIFPKNSYYSWLINDREFAQTKNPKLNISLLPTGLISTTPRKLSVVFKNYNKDFLKSSHLIQSDSLNSVIISSEDLEKRASLGDLPEAHFE